MRVVSDGFSKAADEKSINGARGEENDQADEIQGDAPDNECEHNLS